MNFTTTHNGTFQWPPIESKAPKLLAYSIVLVISLLGNPFIVWTILTNCRLRTTTNFLIANMAISDCIGAATAIPFFVIQLSVDGKWPIENHIGLALCKFMPFLGDVSVAVSMLSCVFIALDRYYAIASPLKRGLKRSNLKFIVVGIWFASVIIVSPYLYYFTLFKYFNWTFCIFHPYPYTYSYLLLLFNAGIPIPIVAVIYILIIYKMHNKVPKRHSHINRRGRRRRERQNRLILKISVAIVSTTFISYMSLGVFSLLSHANLFGDMTPTFRGNLIFSLRLIAFMIFCNNFFIHLSFSRIYRQTLIALIYKCFLYNTQT